MAKSVAMPEADRCELCGVTVAAGFAHRMRHLRGSHPAYARGLLLRLAAPWMFLLAIVVLAAARAPKVAFIGAIFGSFALLLVGKLQSRTERARAGVRPTLPVKRLVREGGLPFLLLVPALALLILLLSKR